MSEALFQALKADLQGHFSKAEERFNAIQSQLDAVDMKVQGGRIGNSGGEPQFKSAGEQFTTGPEFVAAREAKFSGRFAKTGIVAEIQNPFAGRKSVIANWTLGNGTSGVLMPTRLPGITGLAQQRLRIRDLMTVRPMESGNAFDWIRQTTRSNGASPQQESSPKAESTYGWSTEIDSVRTIAHYTNATRQALADSPWLRGAIDGELLYGLLLKEESEVLSGDGNGEHLNGIITQATAYNTGLNVVGDTRLDKLRHAILQCENASFGAFPPDAIVLNPTDLHNIELIKDENGGANKGLYVVGDPRNGTSVSLIWGLPTIASHSITAGNFLVGAFGTAAELIDRQTATIEISLHHDVNFTKNMATILCEERVGLAVRRPDAFVYGAF
jgi:HK97 family phage major capsid protein